MTAGAVAIVLAAGSGERLGRAEPKAFLEVGGTPMVVRAAEAAAACPAVGSLVVTVPRGHERTARAIVAPGKPVIVVAGGRSRHASVAAALTAVPDGVSFVVCHDAARPFASPQQFVLVLGALQVIPDAAGAIPVVPVTETVKRVRGGFVVRTEGSREELTLAQTPQAFRASALRDAHGRAAQAGREFSDDAAALEWAGYRVAAVAGDQNNFKITTPQDLALAELFAAERARG
ncbi:MAG TPA: 2-C-methyl-D-erythritol 4-phosphate cytidylyltransferase [Actinomycetota bacterium]|nr:2-C-methyl-D-erythritol 4-phosphate cytidylyltransferase [Actinomycetota bacterium]